MAYATKLGSEKSYRTGYPACLIAFLYGPSSPRSVDIHIPEC